MRLNVAAMLADAWAMFRHDRAVLLGLAGPFWLWPSLALSLLLPPAPELDPAGSEEARAQVMAQWLAGQLPWLLLVLVAALCGVATVYALYDGRARPTLAHALRRGLLLAPRLLLASALPSVALLPLVLIAAALPAGSGVPIWLIGALYVSGRLLPLGPVLASDSPIGVIAALRRAWALTRGAGLPLAMALGTVLGTATLAQAPLLFLDGLLRANDGGVNPVAVAIVDVAAAVVSTAAALASALLAVAAYRRLANRGI